MMQGVPLGPAEPGPDPRLCPAQRERRGRESYGSWKVSVRMVTPMASAARKQAPTDPALFPRRTDLKGRAKELWLDYDKDKALYSSTPTLAFTAEESEDMTAVNVDIYTTVRTEISRFMMGEQELNDETWQAYVDKIEAMGLAELQEYYETAYARYQDR